MGAPPQRIDVLTSISGVDFEQAWKNSRHEVLDGLPVKVIGKKDLLTNKLASGRPKDKIDAAWLQGEM